MQPTRTEAIKAFLKYSTHPDLAGLYNPHMEVQVIVAQDGGERIAGEFQGVKWAGYTDNDTTWKPFRIPRNADTKPEYVDQEMKFDLVRHAEGIGMTGWDWYNKVSKWVAFDFDAITGHSDAHTRIASQDDLNMIRESASNLPWVTVRHSTSGKGLHLYVMLNDVSTANHCEHAALARAILSQMSALCGFDFHSKVDTCGGNMWVWHRKMKGTRGLLIIKKGTTLDTPPTNWQQHITVIKGKTSRSRHTLESEKLEGLTSQRNKIPLDADHLKLIHWLNDNCKKSWWWDADRHMLVCHTHDLKSAHEQLNFCGIFETISQGKSEQNCFAFPMRQGAWSVRRFTEGVSEHQSWEQDNKNWTRCYYNREPDLRAAAQAFGGLEDPSGGFQFQSGTDAIAAGVALGATINIPPGMDGRTATLKPHKDGKRLIVEFPRESHDKQSTVPNWLGKPSKWIAMFPANIKPSNSEIDSDDFDDVVRHLVTHETGDSGWVIYTNSNWNDEPLTHVRLGLEAMGLKKNEVQQVVGNAVFKPWKLVIKPFQPIYPGNREWNRQAPQLRFTPNNQSDLQYPTWRQILNHVGKELDKYLVKHSWFSAYGILTGEDYLKCWIASMIQYPLEPLPYLFFYSEKQNTGKSMFHESVSKLFTPGFTRADQALKNDTYNGELENAVFCVVEETNLSQHRSANDRMKDWVTADMLPIHRKHCTPYHVPNSTHWVQTSQSLTNLPIFPGDTRVTVIHVPQPPEQFMNRRELFNQLEKEAPDFLAALLQLELPQSPDRLRIPVIETDAKTSAMDATANMIEVFIKEKCFDAPGYVLKLSEFYETFIAWLEPIERHNWGSKQKVSVMMPERFPKGRLLHTSTWHWGNISFEAPTEERQSLIAVNQILIPEGRIHVKDSSP